MEKVLTVVVPSYNVEKYIRQTLESLNHKAILEAIEVLVVDDGSSDDTAKIGKEYEEQYPRTYRVISKSNGGHGSTINCGIEQARGTFFKVVDGDDWVDTEAFVNVVEKLRRCQADYVITDYCEVYDNTGERVRKSFPELDSMEHREWSFQEIADLVQIPMHALIIRTSILKENKIRLDEHRFYVDVVSGSLCRACDLLSDVCIYVPPGKNFSKCQHSGISEAYAGPYGCDPATD